jgi:hypothetical protein
MADQRQPGETRTQFEQSAFIERLVPNPAQTPEVRFVSGFLGRSAQDGYVRLYLTPDLNEYLEIREEDIVHTQALATEQNPLGGHAVWMRRDATVQHTRTMSRQVQAEFLQGNITAGYLAGAGAQGLPVETAGVARLTWGEACLSLFCPSIALRCGPIPTRGCPQ